MKPIKNLLFDLGGVLYHISYQQAFDAFAPLSKVSLKQHFQQLSQTDFFNDIDEGRLDPKEFLLQLRKLIQVHEHVSDEQLLSAWDQILLHPAPKWQDWLHNLSRHYSLYLLSNNNELHLASIKASYPESTPYSELEKYFEDLYYSHTLQARKPKMESFEKVMALSSLKGGETLFIDDTLPNIEAAQSVGLQTFHFAHNGPLEQLSFLLPPAKIT